MWTIQQPKRYGKWLDPGSSRTIRTFSQMYQKYFLTKTLIFGLFIIFNIFRPFEVMREILNPPLDCNNLVNSNVMKTCLDPLVSGCLAVRFFVNESSGF